MSNRPQGAVNKGDESPVFGERVAGASYIRRPSAYAIIANGAGQVAVIHLVARLPSATQLTYSQAEQTYFEKLCAFFAATVAAPHYGDREEDHEVLWVPTEEATALISHGSHRWALRGNA